MRSLLVITASTLLYGCSCQSEQGLNSDLGIVPEDDQTPAALEVAPLLIDWGVQFGDQTETEYVTITNVGGGELTITSLELIAPDGVWTYEDPPELELRGGFSTNFPIVFVHGSPIAAAGILRIGTDAPDGIADVELVVHAPADTGATPGETGDTAEDDTGDTGGDTSDTGLDTADTGDPTDTGPDPCPSCDPLAAPFGAGTGAVGDPWQVCTYAHLDQVRNYSADAFLLCEDIDMTGQTFQPIPTFTGDFNGSNNALDNWSFTDQNAVTGTQIALFTEIGGTVRDLLIDNAALTIYETSAILSRRVLTGGVVSRVTIDNSTINAIDGHIAGGIVTVDVGGLVDDLRFNGTVATVGTGGFVGGLIDTCQGVCTRLLAEGTLSSNGWKTGGLVQSTSGGLVSGGISRMTINATNRVGGIMAVMNGGVIEDCYFEGTINGTYWVTGILAETWNTPNPEIRRSYASGALNPTQQANGIAGAGVLAWDAANAVVTDSGWDQQSTGVVFSDDGVGMQTAGMQDPAHPLFTNWNAPWILTFGNYPRLDWE